MRESFILYTKYKEHIDLLNTEQKGRLFEAIMAYTCEEEIPAMDPITSMAFSFIRSQLQMDEEKYQETVKKRSEAGKKHAGNQHSKKSEKPVANELEQSGTNGTDNDNENVNDNDNVLEKERVKEKVANAPKPTQRFVKPSREEVAAFIMQNQYIVNPDHFYDYYESNGWMIGRNKMKDWKATVRSWNSKERPKPNKPTGYVSIPEPEYMRTPLTPEEINPAPASREALNGIADMLSQMNGGKENR